MLARVRVNALRFCLCVGLPYSVCLCQYVQVSEYRLACVTVYVCADMRTGGGAAGGESSEGRLRRHALAGADGCWGGAYLCALTNQQGHVRRDV